MKRPILLILVAQVIAYGLHAQLTIGSGSTVKVKGEVSARASVENNSSLTDLSTAQVFLVGTDQTINTTTPISLDTLYVVSGGTKTLQGEWKITRINLTGTNQTLSASSPLSVQGLRIDGGGTKTLQGEWTVTRDLTFAQGIVALSSISANAGKLIYTGNSRLEGNTNSFVNGILYQRGAGSRFFPIGVGSTYTPMAFGSIQDGSLTVGVKAFTLSASLDLPVDISAIANNRYWEVTSTGAIRGSGVKLYSPGTSIDGSQRLAVVEADAVGAIAVNLGGGIADDFVVSLNPATKPILTIAISETVDLQINDLITPFNADMVNDKLKIVNINYTFQNTVTLLDRWGVPVKKWKNFTNYDDPINPNSDTFDFAGLSPGNYICVLEYQFSADSPKETKTQMITVLKGN